MNVSTVGVKGYEYQYKVTVMIVLIFNAEKIKLYVEKAGGEDALLEVENNGEIKRIEVQVKRENSPIDISKLIRWVCHFQEKKSDKNLLQKLIDSNDNIVFFVTHSRCSDATSILKTELNNTNNRSISITKKWFDEFIYELNNIKIGETDLKKKREIFCQNQAQKIHSKNELNKLLERCLILEEFTDEKVDQIVTTILNRQYKIAQSKTELIYLQLLEIVKNGRDTGEDIYGKIKKHIQSNEIGNPIIDSLYKVRSEEQELNIQLEKEGVVLLTGISQCGKTELAKKIAKNYVEKGYDYGIFDEIGDLKRFISSNVSDNKITILSDPFGHILLKENYLEILYKLKEIIINLENHHLLIVTTRIEILFDVFNTININDCKLKNLGWYDLTIKNNTVISKFWEYLAKENTLPEDIIEIVNTGLLKSRQEYLLQIGQLNYLVNEEIDNLINKNFHELEHIARRDSIEIATQLKRTNQGAADLLSIISICSTPTHGVEIKDLKYIISDNTQLLSIPEKTVFTRHFNVDESPSFPKYPENLEFSANTIDSINYLEDRHFITIKNNVIILTHPNYYEAGRHLFFDKGTLKIKSNIEYYKKCISCLNPKTALTSSKNLQFVYSKIKPELKNDIIEIGFLGLDSIFPSIEDNSLIFLIKVIKDLKEERLNYLAQKIQRGGTHFSNINWFNGIPYISDEGGFLNKFIRFENNEISQIELELSENRLPSSYQLWGYILSLKDNREISQKIFRQLLQSNEAFLRIEVVHQIFRRSNILDDKFVVDLFSDEHPSVVFHVISASISNWFNFSENLKTLIQKLIIESFNKQHVAIRSYQVISTFSVDYGHESIIDWKEFNESQKKELWNLWGKIYPACVSNIPLDLHFNSARFGSTIRESIKYMDKVVGIEVLNAWYNRIDYQISNNKFLDEFEMSIAWDMMDLTLDDYLLRENLFHKLANYNNTNFILVSLKWIIGYWGNLHTSEKSKIIALIHSNRKDIRWIKAVLLNSYSPPKEIVLEILGDKDLFEKPINRALSVFPDQLLRDCLNVFCGFPQPLWWLAVHHRNFDYWGKVIRHILLDENHIGFDICIEEFLSGGVNGFSDKWNDWEKLWESICFNTRNKKILFERLLYNTSTCTCNLTTTKMLWRQLIESYNKIGKQSEIEILIIDNIEILEQTLGGKDDLFEFFEKDFLFNKVIANLIPDILIINFIESINSTGIDIKNLNDYFDEVTKTGNIRFIGTFNYINNFLNRNNDSKHKFIHDLKSLESKIDIIGKEGLKKLNKFDYKLDDWIGIN